MGVKMVGIRKNAQGLITHIKTNAGAILPFEEVQQMARAGELDSVTDLHPDGTWRIEHTAGDDGEASGSNLDSLPEI